MGNEGIQMSKQIMTKNTAIEKLKSGSLGIAVLCLIAAGCNAAFAVARLITAAHDILDTINRYMIYRSCISFVISVVIMVIAAFMFFRISKDGIPFTAKNVRSVRIIGILFLLNAVIPSVTAAGFIGTAKGVGGLVNPSALVEGLLFLFIAHIIRYGAMLQQESDETL